MTSEDQNRIDDNIIAQFNTFEDFLDSQITSLDLYYLEDDELARQLVELGYRGSGEVLKREEFEQRKAENEAAKLTSKFNSKKMASSNKKITDKFLKELESREESNRMGKLSTIIYIRDIVKKQEISGYIDYQDRLANEDFEQIFSGKKKLLPKPTDLSYYNWETHASYSNSSPNYSVITDNPSGLFFKNKKDRKLISTDPKGSLNNDITKRIPIYSDKYLQIVFFDHKTRRKTFL